MKSILFLVLLISVNVSNAQMPETLEGQYRSSYNGDVIRLSLKQQTPLSYNGQMNDSYQQYDVTLLRDDNKVTGSATEKSMGLIFNLTGTVLPLQLNLIFKITLEGVENSMDLTFEKLSDDADEPSTLQRDPIAKIQFPEGATHPEALIGTWAKEELYQSGAGDNYMGAGFSESMTFLPGGQLADAGSEAYISGNQYSGQSSSQGLNIIPGVSWFTVGNQLYLKASENGMEETYHLGKYYIENGHLLITSTNGEKLLLTKR